MRDDRWEYRIWPESGAEKVARITSLLGQELKSEYRSDVYFLTPAEHISAKIRGGKLFEVKELLENRGGCERWVKAVEQPVSGSRTLDGLLGEAKETELGKALLEAAIGSIAIVDVRKHRRLFQCGTSEVEATSVMVAGKRLDTLALESPSYEECSEIASKLGFMEQDNTDYGTVLRALR
ncbi:hypothetical protein [Parvularcula lutaonensis]|uniref:CYTH domain-containing protein n=1 Tax=Parvularcula lutaonensis TaxID=491923 RepID=A0ABV7MBE1_9PROT|nr:hypothetical protein [Parvularcula lutaonensis]GGY36102.1 hypothetical protein GCM10007148_00260 [Parvularcula lutaonensis]